MLGTGDRYCITGILQLYTITYYLHVSYVVHYLHVPPMFYKGTISSSHALSIDSEKEHIDLTTNVAID